MFEATHPFLLFDYLRVPYALELSDGSGDAGDDAPVPRGNNLRLSGWEQVRYTASSSARSLFWPVQVDANTSAGFSSHSPAWGQWHVGSVPIYCGVVPDNDVTQQLGALEGVWTRHTPVRDVRGHNISSIWQNDRGDILLPFDPAEAITSYWSEAYHNAAGRTSLGSMKRIATRTYYRLRPLLPRRSQIGMRQVLSHLQARTRFPRWPVESALHDLFALLLRCVADLARAPVPWLSPWPRGYTWSFVLTHDVETALGYRNIHVLRDIERVAGFRSSWNFVPMRYAVEDATVSSLAEDGFEVGVHGLYHDGRDLESLALLDERLPAIRAHAQRWGAIGFRSPATHRVWDWMPLLGFDYDSSYPDTDPFEPQAGGCCSWLPYFNKDLVELPITLVQDHTLFVIRKQRDETLWVEKARHLKANGGMALLITHPDYMLDEQRVSAYRRLLGEFESDSTVWRALPREVSAWWRRRAASRLEPVGDTWQVIGPAAGEARVMYAQPSEATP